MRLLPRAADPFTEVVLSSHRLFLLFPFLRPPTPEQQNIRKTRYAGSLGLQRSHSAPQCSQEAIARGWGRGLWAHGRIILDVGGLAKASSRRRRRRRRGSRRHRRRRRRCLSLCGKFCPDPRGSMNEVAGHVRNVSNDFKPLSGPGGAGGDLRESGSRAGTKITTSKGRRKASEGRRRAAERLPRAAERLAIGAAEGRPKAAGGRPPPLPVPTDLVRLVRPPRSPRPPPPPSLLRRRRSGEGDAPPRPLSSSSLARGGRGARFLDFRRLEKNKK